MDQCAEQKPDNSCKKGEGVSLECRFYLGVSNEHPRKGRYDDHPVSVFNALLFPIIKQSLSLCVSLVSVSHTDLLFFSLSFPLLHLLPNELKNMSSTLFNRFA